MWKWIKIPKGIALLSFLLPWLTVSCSGTPLVKGSGWQLIIGKLEPVGELAKGGGATPSATPQEFNVMLAIAVAVIAIGLAISCLKYSKQLALAVAATSAAAFVLIELGTGKYSKSAMLADMPKGQAEPGMDPAAMAAMIQINWEIGFYLALIGVLVAGAMAVLVYMGKDSLLGGSSAAAVEDPPEI
jgi:hypothetical protein